MQVFLTKKGLFNERKQPSALSFGCFKPKQIYCAFLAFVSFLYAFMPVFSLLSAIFFKHNDKTDTGYRVYRAYLVSTAYFKKNLTLYIFQC